MHQLFKNAQRRILAECGHRTDLKGFISFSGEQRAFMIAQKNGTTPYCHACLAKMTILCAWCGKPIFVGDPVTLSMHNPESDPPLQRCAVRHSDGSHIGCVRCTCTGAHKTNTAVGVWQSPGDVFFCASIG